MSRYAVIGSGGREHAISWALAKSAGQDNVFTLNGNDAIPNAHPIDFMDFQALQTFCAQHQIDTIVAGSEAPLVKGLYDFFKGSNIRVFGASQAAAQLEGSKIFAKQFMHRHSVKTAPFVACYHPHEANEFIQQRQGNAVIKYDGLAAGKGVYVCDSLQECQAAFDELTQLHGPTYPFIVEEKLLGDELSIIAFTDGQSLRLFLPAQDHKQIFDFDKGPNTGGMGVYCPVHWCHPLLLQQIHKDIIQPTIQGIADEQLDYKGFIYFGIMVTEQGPYNLEYNARLGDPEAEVLLPSIKTPLADIVNACLDQRLDQLHIEYESDYFVDVVKVSQGYPAKAQTGFPITQNAPLHPDTLLFYSGVKQGADGGLLNHGGRVFNVIARAPQLQEAIAKAYQDVDKINFEGNYYRRDIAQRPRRILPKLAVFISGRGSNMQAIYKATQVGGALYQKAEIGFVFSNNPAAEGLAWAAQHGIPTLSLAPQPQQKRADYDKEILALLKDKNFSYIVLAGYMRVLSPVLVNAYAGRIINIHPADTKQHQGLHGYEWAWTQKLATTTITVHRVDEGLDTGQILAQYPVNLEGCQSLEEVEARGLAVEHRAYAEVLAGLLSFEVGTYR